MRDFEYKSYRGEKNIYALAASRGKTYAMYEHSPRSQRLTWGGRCRLDEALEFMRQALRCYFSQQEYFVRKQLDFRVSFPARAHYLAEMMTVEEFIKYAENSLWKYRRSLDGLSVSIYEDEKSSFGFGARPVFSLSVYPCDPRSACVNSIQVIDRAGLSAELAVKDFFLNFFARTNYWTEDFAKSGRVWHQLREKIYEYLALAEVREASRHLHEKLGEINNVVRGYSWAGPGVWKRFTPIVSCRGMNINLKKLTLDPRALLLEDSDSLVWLYAPDKDPYSFLDIRLRPLGDKTPFRFAPPDRPRQLLRLLEGCPGRYDRYLRLKRVKKELAGVPVLVRRAFLELCHEQVTAKK